MKRSSWFFDMGAGYGELVSTSVAELMHLFDVTAYVRDLIEGKPVDGLVGLNERVDSFVSSRWQASDEFLREVARANSRDAIRSYGLRFLVDHDSNLQRLFVQRGLEELRSKLATFLDPAVFLSLNERALEAYDRYYDAIGFEEGKKLQRSDYADHYRDAASRQKLVDFLKARLNTKSDASCENSGVSADDITPENVLDKAKALSGAVGLYHKKKLFDHLEGYKLEDSVVGIVFESASRLSVDGVRYGLLNNSKDALAFLDKEIDRTISKWHGIFEDENKLVLGFLLKGLVNHKYYLNVAGLGKEFRGSVGNWIKNAPRDEDGKIVWSELFSEGSAEAYAFKQTCERLEAAGNMAIYNRHKAVAQIDAHFSVGGMVISELEFVEREGNFKVFKSKGNEPTSFELCRPSDVFKTDAGMELFGRIEAANNSLFGDQRFNHGMLDNLENTGLSKFFLDQDGIKL